MTFRPDFVVGRFRDCKEVTCGRCPQCDFCWCWCGCPAEELDSASWERRKVAYRGRDYAHPQPQPDTPCDP